MNHAQKNIARLGITLLDVLLGIIEKRVAFNFAMGGRQPGGL